MNSYIVVQEKGEDSLTVFPSTQEIYGKVVALIKIRDEFDIMLINEPFDNTSYRDTLKIIFNKLKARA